MLLDVITVALFTCALALRGRFSIPTGAAIALWAASIVCKKKNAGVFPLVVSLGLVSCSLDGAFVLVLGGGVYLELIWNDIAPRRTKTL